MAEEPMSDKRLAEIRRMASRAEVSMMASSDVAVRDLLAEIDRLRAREAAAMGIVRDVASVPDADYIEECPFCHQMPDYIPIKHTPDCPVTKARALLAEESEAH